MHGSFAIDVQSMSDEPAREVARFARFVLVFLFLLVAGDEREAGVEVPVRDGDARVRRRRDGGGDAGDDFEGDANFRQRFALFPAAAEDERVTALEPHDAVAPPGPFDSSRSLI
jgi:hypothetical protein